MLVLWSQRRILEYHRGLRPLVAVVSKSIRKVLKSLASAAHRG